MREKQLAEDFVAWLMTEHNRNGSLYLKNVARCYARYLQTAPLKLNLLLTTDERNVYACRTPEDFLILCNVFRAAPNFKEIDYASSHNSFSAGLQCYARYLNYLVTNIKNDGKSNGVETNLKGNAITLADDKSQFSNEPIITTRAISEITFIVDEEIGAAIDHVLMENFANGFRFTSEIEIGRLRKFVSDLLGKKIMLFDNDIIWYVKKYATEFDGKVYIVSADTKAKITVLVEEYFNEGAVAIFYEEFYAKHELWLFEANIVSKQMLTKILRVAFPQLTFTATYFGKTKESVSNVLKNEILRVWGNDVLLTCDRLAERLAYIPSERIKYALNQNADIIGNKKEEFTHVSKFDIMAKEQDEVRRFAENKIKSNGYISISDIPLDEIGERNYELSRTTVQNAVYYICLADDYDRHGKIISYKHDKLNLQSVIEDHCRTLDHCSLEYLLDLEREITGASHRWAPMQAGYNIMVRTDEKTFLAERFVHFDTASIDNAIERFMRGGEYTALQSVTTFVAFPYCGQVWNLFLLESYCRRFSEHFRFECLAVNSKNCGAIISKYSQLSYHDIISDAVAKSGVDLVDEAVLDFLATNGYIGKRNYKKINEIIKLAGVIRNKQ